MDIQDALHLLEEVTPEDVAGGGALVPVTTYVLLRKETIGCCESLSESKRTGETRP